MLREEIAQSGVCTRSFPSSNGVPGIHFSNHPTVGIHGAVHYRRSFHASKCTVILVSVPQRHKQDSMQGWQYKIPAMRHFLIGRLMRFKPHRSLNIALERVRCWCDSTYGWLCLHQRIGLPKVSIPRLYKGHDNVAKSGTTSLHRHAQETERQSVYKPLIFPIKKHIHQPSQAIHQAILQSIS